MLVTLAGFFQSEWYEPIGVAFLALILASIYLLLPRERANRTAELRQKKAASGGDYVVPLDSAERAELRRKFGIDN